MQGALASTDVTLSPSFGLQAVRSVSGRQGDNDMHDPKLEDHRFTRMTSAGYLNKTTATGRIPRHVQRYENNGIVVGKMLSSA